MTETSKSHGNGDTAADLEKIREDLASLRRDLAKLTSDAKGEDIGGGAAALRQAFRSGESSATAISRGMEERPLITLLLAFGLGFVGGSLLRR